MCRRGALTSLAKGVAVTISVVAASLLTAAAVTALAGLSKELTTIVVIAGIAAAAGPTAIATIDG
jgi:hypothetical protein